MILDPASGGGESVHYARYGVAVQSAGRVHRILYRGRVRQERGSQPVGPVCRTGPGSARSRPADGTYNRRQNTRIPHMSPIIPFWFKQRQCKAEATGVENMLKLSGPILPDAWIYIRPEAAHWIAGLRLSPDGPDVSVANGESRSEKQAWEAAFELYREQVIV